MSKRTTKNERQPLLPPTNDPERHEIIKATPLPKLQLSILLMLQLAEPMTSQIIYSFVNQLVGELDITGGDPKKVGYYAGLIDIFFYAAQALCTFAWSRTSDRIGRRPVLLTGLGGLCLSTLCFGISTTFWGLVISRCTAGVLNGNVAVTKAMLGDITDPTNVASAFAFTSAMWSVGSAIGPVIGRHISHPYERFPTVFHNEIWRQHPFFLPCLVSASFAALSSLITLSFLKEVHERSSGFQRCYAHIDISRPPSVTVQSTIKAEGVLPVRCLMTRPILLSIVICSILAFAEIGLFALQPLFYSTPIEMGGLELSSRGVVICLSAFGVINSVLQALFFARIVGRFGPKFVIITGTLLFPVVMALFPAINYLARARGLAPEVWALILAQLIITVGFEMSITSVYIYINSSAPNKTSLGSVNGMSHTTVSIFHAVGPAMSKSLFAYSSETNWLGGNAAYLMLSSAALVGFLLASRLPKYAYNCIKL